MGQSLLTPEWDGQGHPAVRSLRYSLIQSDGWRKNNCVSHSTLLLLGVIITPTGSNNIGGEGRRHSGSFSSHSPPYSPQLSWIS